MTAEKLKKNSELSESFMIIDKDIPTSTFDYWDEEKDGMIDSFESFLKFEQAMGRKLAASLFCVACKCNSMKCDGGSGNKNASLGHIICSMKCTKCKKGGRVDKVMESSVNDYSQLLKLYNEVRSKFEKVKETKVLKKQASIKSFFNMSEEEQCLQVLINNENKRNHSDTESIHETKHLKGGLWSDDNPLENMAEMEHEREQEKNIKTKKNYRKEGSDADIIERTMTELRQDNADLRKELKKLNQTIENLSNHIISLGSDSKETKELVLESTTKTKQQKQEPKQEIIDIDASKDQQSQINNLMNAVAKLTELVTFQQSKAESNKKQVVNHLTTKNNQSKSNNALDPTPAQAQTFAEVAAKKPKKKQPFSKSKMVKIHSLLAPKPPPLEFTKLWLRINQSGVLKSCKTSNEVTIALRETLKALNIVKDVVQFSKIGNSILEIYVAKDKLEWVKAHLIKGQAEFIPHCPAHVAPAYAVHANPQQMAIQRMAFLYKGTTNRNLRECILSGESKDTHDAVISLVHSTAKLKGVNILSPDVIYHDEKKSTPADLLAMIQKENLSNSTSAVFESEMDVDLSVTSATSTEQSALVEQETIAAELPVEMVVEMDVDFAVASGTSVSVLPSGDIGVVVPKRS